MTDLTAKSGFILHRSRLSDEESAPLSSRSSGATEREIVCQKLAASLSDQQDYVVKEWLKNLIDDLGLASLKTFPTQELARDLPALIGFVVDRMRFACDNDAGSITVAEFVSSIGSVRKEDQSLRKLLQDYSLLKRLMLEAAADGLRRSDRAVVDSIIAIDDVFQKILQAGIEGLERGHADDGGPVDIDPLTNLFNVRYFRRQLHRQLEMYKRYRTPFSLIMLDLDGLEQLNDSLGNEAGDQALQNLAAILLEEKRETDIAVRYGGDEFFLILPGTITVEGERLAYRLSRRVKELNLRSGGAQMTGVSVGIVSCPENGADVATLRSRADKAMYMAKLLGGNRVARFRDFQQS